MYKYNQIISKDIESASRFLLSALPKGMMELGKAHQTGRCENQRPRQREMRLQGTTALFQRPF